MDSAVATDRGLTVLAHLVVNVEPVHQFKGVEDWIDAHRSENVYWCPHLFSEARRREECAMPSQYAWVDLDEVDPRKLRYRPTIAIQTSPGRYQGLWEFDKPLLKSMRKGLNDFCKGDSGGWMLTKVLRVPGCKNFKYDPPPRVKTLWDDGPLYRKNDMLKLAVDVPDVDEEGGPRPVGNADAILKRYRVDRSLLDTCVPPRDGRPGQRSDVIWKIEVSLVEAGATRDEVGSGGLWVSEFQVEARAQLDAVVEGGRCGVCEGEEAMKGERQREALHRLALKVTGDCESAPPKGQSAKRWGTRHQ